MSGKKEKKKRGPGPETLRIGRKWADAIRRALRKKKPKEGWPKEVEEKSNAD